MRPVRGCQISKEKFLLPEEPNITTAVATTQESQPPARRPARVMTKRAFRKTVERKLMSIATEVTDEYWESMKRGLKADNNKVREIMSRILGYDKGPNGVSVTTNIMQSQVNGDTRRRSFESMIEEMERKASEERVIDVQAEDQDNNDE